MVGFCSFLSKINPWRITTTNFLRGENGWEHFAAVVFIWYRKGDGILKTLGYKKMWNKIEIWATIIERGNKIKIWVSLIQIYVNVCVPVVSPLLYFCVS